MGGSESLIVQKGSTITLTTLTAAATQHWVVTLVALFALYVVYEQALYRYRKSSLPGPAWVTPLIGGIVTMVQDPVSYWHGQAEKYGNLSWNALIGKLLIFSHGASTTRKILESSSDDLPLWLHPNAVTLLGNDNMAFINGPSHKALRHVLLPLFTPKALALYLKIQEKAIKEHFALWFDDSKANPQGISMQERVWNLNANTSLNVFVGTYLEGQPELRNAIINNYRKVTDGFLAFPINLPGTLLHTALQGRIKLIDLLIGVVARCRERMRGNAEPECLLDFWMITAGKQYDEALAAGQPAPEHTTDQEMAKIMFDFLFASQDASTASICWSIHLVSQHPDVLAKLRAEQKSVRPNNEPLTYEILSSMPYTYQVMREILRFRPPATMVPHQAKKPFKLTDDYTVPAGSLVIPFIFGGTHQGYQNPDVFDPDRFSAERAEDKKFSSNFLTFGCGPHACLGYRYAMNHIMCLLALLTSEVDYKRKVTPTMDKIRYFSTIYPDDGVILEHFRPLQAKA